MTKKNIFPVVATIAVVGVVLGVFSTTVLRDSNVSISTMTSEQAYANLSSKMKRIGVQKVKVNPQQLDVSEFLDAKDELPGIESSYPFVAVGNGDVNIEIFSSGEKAAESGSDSFLTEMAKKFNAQHNKTSGDKTMSVSLRSIPSGTAAEYINPGDLVSLNGEVLVVHSTHTNKKGAVNAEFKTPGKSGQKSASLKKLKIVKAADSMHSAWEKIS